MNELQKNLKEQLTAASQLPQQAEYTFDSHCHEPENKYLPIQKTIRRTVTCLEYSTFQAREVLRKNTETESKAVQRSSDLQTIVAKGHRYAYDLIAFVGKRAFLDGRKLTAIKEELIQDKSFSNIPFSSLYDCQRKFLFFLGELHRQAAPRIKEHLQKRSDVTWLIDGTLEPGSLTFFGVKEAKEGFFLGSWKIPTENEEDISRCLTEAANEYGKPDRILHDLSERVDNACSLAFPNTLHNFCNYHFLANMGKDLYEAPQAELSKRLRAIKLQVSLKNQRGGQTQRLRKAVSEENISLALSDLLSGKEMNICWSESFGREVLLALHSWLLDYPDDGHRQGFPFDPYLLYFHRRIVVALEASNRLLSCSTIREKMPKVFFNFYQQLENYLLDLIICRAASLYEKANNIFGRVRSTLRLFTSRSNPMHDLYELSSDSQEEVKNALGTLRNEFYEENIKYDDPKEYKLYETALAHIDKYGARLLPSDEFSSREEILVRTTNGIESDWSSGKRIRRQTHGRKKLTRDFQALPAEFMLIPNLRNQRYIDLVIGSLDQLPEKFAEAGIKAGPYSHWYKKGQPLNIGRLSKRLLRDDNFIDDLIGISEVVSSF